MNHFNLLKAALVVVAISWAHPGSAQHFFPDSADYYFEVSRQFPPNWYYQNTLRFIREDNNDEYYTYDANSKQQPDTVMYSSQKVYYKISQEDSFFLLFDFTVQKGDTLTTRHSAQGWSIPLLFYVDSVDQVVLGSRIRKRIFLKPLESSNGHETEHILIAGIGTFEMGLDYYYVKPDDTYGLLGICSDSLKVRMDYWKKITETNDSICDHFAWLVHSPEVEMPGVNVYPNPFFDQLTVDLGIAGKRFFTISIRTVQGVEVYTKTTNANVSHIQVAELHSGMYILQIITDSGTFEQWVVKL